MRVSAGGATGGAPGTVAPPRRVAPPVVWETGSCFAVSRGTPLVSARLGFARFPLPPLFSAIHAPPPARITTTPIVAGMSDRFFLGADAPDIRCVAPEEGTMSWVFPSVSPLERVCGTAALLG